jgi:hypothetical protein
VARDCTEILTNGLICDDRLTSNPCLPVPTVVLQKRHKEELERRLAEIEEARRIFSRPNVLVQAKT